MINAYFSNTVFPTTFLILPYKWITGIVNLTIPILNSTSYFPLPPNLFFPKSTIYYCHQPLSCKNQNIEAILDTFLSLPPNIKAIIRSCWFCLQNISWIHPHLLTSLSFKPPWQLYNLVGLSVLDPQIHSTGSSKCDVFLNMQTIQCFLYLWQLSITMQTNNIETKKSEIYKLQIMLRIFTVSVDRFSLYLSWE